MKKKYGLLTTFVLILLIFLVECYSKENTSSVNPPFASPAKELTQQYTPSPTIGRTQTPKKQESVPPDLVSSPILLPMETLSPQESESRLLNLLETNGNCVGKCIGGVYPEQMTLQQAVNQLAQWGTVLMYQNPREGTFYRIDQQSLDGRIWVQFGVGTWTKERAVVNDMGLRITGISDLYIDSDAWKANQNSWHGSQLDQIMMAYGVPSDVRFGFSTEVKGKWLTEGKTISYLMHISYKQLNLDVDLAGLAHDDGQKLFLCPSTDPHYLNIQFNSGMSEEKLAEGYPVTWQKLMDTDLPSFYQRYTHPSASECISPLLSQIVTLQPDLFKISPPN